MRLRDCASWVSELDSTLEAVPEASELDGRTLMVTGAAGLVCSALVELLMRRNEAHGGDVRLLLAGRWPEEMEARFGAGMRGGLVQYVPYDASRSGSNDLPDFDFCVHGASNAHPGMIMREPVETMLSNFEGVREVLDHAARQGHGRVLYVSSSEVYGRRSGAGPAREGDCGTVEVLSPRSSYSVGKMAAETLCASYVAEHGADVVIVRPGHVYGPTASPQDTRVGSAWAWAAARKDGIVMKSEGRQLRSYVHCLDCATAMLDVLLRGGSGRAYNVANPASVLSIARLAETLSRVGGVGLARELPSEREARGFNPMEDSSLDPSALEALGWHGRYGAEAGLSGTVRTLRELLGDSESGQGR